MKHISVLKDEAISLLGVKDDGVYIDGTLGRGGHSLEIVKRLKNGHLYSFDLDSSAINESSINLKDYQHKCTLIHDNYANMFKHVDQVDGILLDLGVSSPQFDDGGRGFSYRYDARLDMRMDKGAKLDAYELVNNADVDELTRIFRDYGEEKFAYKIAKEIEKNRLINPIETTFELVEIIKKAKPAKILKTKGHPAKQVFQALRIAVNHELESLEVFLENFDQHLKANGRVVIITFHSLEDRLVKRKFKELSAVIDDKRLMLKAYEIPKPNYELINRKPIIANDEENIENPRAKSAKLRGIMKNM